MEDMEMINRQMKYLDNQSYLGTYSDIKKEFMEDFELALKHNKSFSAMMQEIIKDRDAKEYYSGRTKDVRIKSRRDFQRVTELSPSVYDRIMDKDPEKNYIPSLQTVMTLCIVYNLSMGMAYTLLGSVGVTFKGDDKVHNAYILILTKCRGKSIDECNKILKEIGIEEKYWLGFRKNRRLIE